MSERSREQNGGEGIGRERGPAREPRIPPLREDLTIKPEGKILVLEDPVQRKVIRLGPEGASLVSALREGARTPGALRAACGEIAPSRTQRHLAMFVHEHLLQTGRWRDQAPLFREAHAKPYPAPQELPVRLLPGLHHECVACGSSCSAVDVGPVGDATVEAVDQHSLWREVPGAKKTGDVFLRVRPREGPMRLMARRRDSCVMLSRKNRCRIHEVAGMTAKPPVCRQFPLTFTRGRDAVYVSLSMECRSYLRAREAGAAMDEREAEDRARERIATGALLTDLLDPVPLAPGLVLPQDEYLQLERSLLEAIDAAPAEEDPVRTWARCAESVARMVQERSLVYQEEEQFLESGRWGRETAEGEADPRAALENLLQALADVSLIKERRTLESGRYLLSERASFFAKCALVLAGEVPMTRPYWCDGAGPGVLRDTLRAEIWGKDAFRWGDFLWIVSRLGLTLLFARAGAELRAFQAARLPMYGQDAVDAVVGATFMMRDKGVLNVLQGMSGTLRWSLGRAAGFVTHLDEGSPPPRPVWAGSDRLGPRKSKAKGTGEG
jgi:Fe-S-cluster containining protein